MFARLDDKEFTAKKFMGVFFSIITVPLLYSFFKDVTDGKKLIMYEILAALLLVSQFDKIKMETIFKRNSNWDGFINANAIDFFYFENDLFQ